MSKSSKLDSAISRARNVTHEGVVEDEPSTSLATIGEAQVQASIQALDPAMLAQLVASGEIEAAPQLLTLQSGQMITGLIDTRGTTTLEDENTKQPKEVGTWQISLVGPDRKPTGLRVSILSSSQLDRMLPEHLATGRAVIIARGGDIKIKGGKKNMTEYFVGAYKAAAGQ